MPEQALFKPCAVIPVYNHEHALPVVVEQLRLAHLPVILVDDGSSASCAAVIDHQASLSGVSCVRLAENQGKGGAVMTGLRYALEQGFSHAIQIDADGQHDLAPLEDFLEAARLAPEQMICGYPQYDESVPRGRLYGRYLTHVWVWINTLSLSIRDSMCGFRVYPLPATVALINSEKLGRRMDFDIEILVRLYWREQPMQWFPVAVHYPLDGVSHFQAWQDNLRISGMHTRLFFGMLRRLPKLLWRKVKA